MREKMQISKIEKLVVLIREAFKECQSNRTEDEIEKVALVVYDSMANPGRNFHNIHHVFDVAQGLKGIGVLAAIFHDIIYYQVDRGFRTSVEKSFFSMWN